MAAAVIAWILTMLVGYLRHATKVTTSNPRIAGRHDGKYLLNLHELRNAILADRDAALASASGNPGAVKVSGFARLLWNHPHWHSNLANASWLFLALAVTMVTGVPLFLVLILDALAGDWLTDHVSFWDELTRASDWVADFVGG